MTDREYIKLNTSIQTASNARNLAELADGTVPAVIELRLPDNLYDSQVGNKKIDSVSMLTTKFRLSLSETPIVQVPIDEELSAKYGTNVTKCKLDVFPFTLNDKMDLKPTPDSEHVGDTSFPFFKKHAVNYDFFLVTFDAGGHASYEELDDFIYYNANDFVNQFPTDQRMSSLITGNDLLEDHLMNMCVPSSHESLRVEDGNLLIKNIATLEQMLEEAIENAITYASTETESHISIYVCSLADADYIINNLPDEPKPNKNIVVHLDEKNIDVCYWKKAFSSYSENHLKHAVKPDVSFTGDSFLLSYDTAAFQPIVPFLANGSYVNTHEVPIQCYKDSLRNPLWLEQPPPKRVLRGNVETEGEDLSSLHYQMTLQNPLDTRAFNIVANRETMEVFSFLPWVNIPYSDLSKYKEIFEQYKITTFTEEVTKTVTTSSFRYGRADDSHSGYVYASKVSFSNHEQFADPDLWHYSFGEINGDFPDLPTELENALPPKVAMTSASAYAAFALVFDFFTDDSGYVAHSNDLNYVSSAFHKTIVLPTYSYMEGEKRAFELLPFWGQNVVEGDSSVYSEYPPVETSSTETSVISEKVVTYECETGTEVISRSETHLPTTFTQTKTPFSSISRQFCRVVYTRSGWEYYGRNWMPSSRVDEWTEQRYRGGVNSQAALDSRQIAYSFQKYLPGYAPTTVGLIGQPFTYEGRECQRAFWIWPTCFDGGSSGPRNPGLLSFYSSTAIYTAESVSVSKETTVKRVTTELSDGLTEVKTKESYPNFYTGETDGIYMLNAGTTDVSIGSEEVIQGNSKLNKVTKTITVGTQTEETESRIYDSGSSSPYLDVTATRTDTQGVRFDDGVLYNCISFSYREDADTHEKTLAYLYASFKDSAPLVSLSTAPLAISTTNSSNFSITSTTTTEESTDTLVYPGETREALGAATTTTVDGNRTSVAKMFFFQLLDPVTRKPFWIDTYEIPPEYTRLDPSQADICNVIPNISPMYSRSIEGPGYIAHEWYWAIYRATFDESFTVMRTNSAVESYTSTTTTTQPIQKTEISVSPIKPSYEFNKRIQYSWSNVPTVVLSPIQSFVIVLNGMNVSQEIHPINIAQPGSSSLISTIPIVENYYSLASTLRDLHDELVVVRDSYADATFYKLDTTSGQERTITLAAKYITKDGKLHQIYIPKNGVFNLQLTFGISYYLA